jgi:hypothetical protein
MDEVRPATGVQSPFDVYSNRLHELHRLKAADERREKLTGYAKLALAAVTLVSAVWSLHPRAHIELLLVPIVLFVLLAAMHEKLSRAIRLHTRSIEFYERGAARLENRWAGKGETGDRFLDPQHPYARDLDLFGQASLFELLSTGRTRAGEETLAAWLLAAAPVDEISARQEAIRDLTARVQFRERLFLLGETMRTGVHPKALAAWGASSPVFPARAARTVTSLLALLWIASLAAWGLWDLGWLAAVMTLVNLGWSRQLSARLDKAAGAVEHATQDLELLSGVLSLLEQEQFVSSKLVSLQAALNTENVAPSTAIRRLARIVEYLNHRHNLFFRPLDRVTFWSAQLVFAAERWQQKFGPRIRIWLSAVGEMEALTSLSAYAYEHQEDVFPEVIAPATSGPLFEAEGLAHPLLPSATSIRNSVTLGDGLQLIILSGPNMAGKSTFIRSIGMNAVLAQCGAPVRATHLRLSPLNVAASICILDSLSGGVSRFYAEIQKVKRIADLTSGSTPVLFLFDELLSGTNSHDRLAGTEFIVRTLVARNAIGIVSTHDLALARIPETMGSRAANHHFEDRLENGQLIFDYKLKTGIVQTSNALELMRAIGLTVTN